LSRADARLESIESKLAFQEDMLLQLNEALVAQQARIDKLEAAFRTLAEQVQTPADDPEEHPEPPPHY
jgi:SlyX protein